MRNKIITTTYDFKLLKTFTDNSIARKCIDDFLKKKHLEYNNFNSQELRSRTINFFTNILNDFILLKSKLSSEHNINPEAISLYFNLDKIIFPLVKRYLRNLKLNPLLIITFNETEVKNYIEGSNIEYFCSSKESAVFSHLVSNIDAFPVSTRKYLKRKIEQYNFSDITSIDNQFVAKMFLSQFDSKFRITKFRSVLKKLSKDIAYSNLSTSLFLFHNAVFKKYELTTGKESELLYKFLSEIIYEVFSCYFKHFNPSENDFIFISNKIMHDQLLCNSFARACMLYNVKNHISLLPLFLCDQDFLSKNNKDLRILIGNAELYYLFKGDQIPSKYWKNYFELVKKKFLEKNDVFTTFLVDNSRILNTNFNK